MDSLKASLSNSCTEKEIRHHPTLIFCKGAFLDVWFLQKQLRLLLVIGFDMAFIDLDRLHFEVGKIALVHKEMQSCYQISQIRIDTDIVIKS